MKVKCIRTSISNPDKNIINSDMRDYLSVGSVFTVYGVNFSQGVVYYYIFNGNHLFEVPSELFEIKEGNVSPIWIIKVRRNGDVCLWPELFYREGFFENFSDHEINERNEFIALQQIIEQ